MRKGITGWREKIGIWKILVLWLPFYVFLGWFGEGFFYYPLWSVLSGKYWKWLHEIFRTPFDIIHAGSALDQPTVGKFFFWYGVLSFLAIAFAVIIRFFTDMQKKSNHRTYFILYMIVFLFVMSVMLMPATLLAHYIIAMGMTATRFQGIICLLGSILIWPILGWFLLRIKKAEE